MLPFSKLYMGPSHIPRDVCVFIVTFIHPISHHYTNIEMPAIPCVYLVIK
jgi:hypothetical protein